VKLCGYGLAPLPGVFDQSGGRRDVKELTGNRCAPTLLLEAGTVIDGSAEIAGSAGVKPA